MKFDKICMIPGYAYVPEQKLMQTYNSEKGLERGTIFPELDLPMDIYGKQDISEICEEVMKMEEGKV